MMNIAAHPREMQLFSTHNILSFASKLKATEPRDKVYALLGLLGNDFKSFSINYSEDVETIYQEMTCAIITKSKSLNILNGNRSHPSWRCMQATWTMGLYQIEMRDRAIDVTRVLGPPFTWDRLAKTLTIQAYRLT